LPSKTACQNPRDYSVEANTTLPYFLLISESGSKLVEIFCTNVEKVPRFEIIPQYFYTVDCIRFIDIYSIVFIGASNIS
jgi:hypothetical protein